MPILVEWGNDEQTILYYSITDDWTLDHALSILENETTDMINSVSHVPDCIMDLCGSKKIPMGFLRYWRRTYDWMQANNLESSFVVIAQAPPVLKGISDTLRTLRIPIMRYVLFVNTIEEAYQKIAEHRANNPRLHPDN